MKVFVLYWKMVIWRIGWRGFRAFLLASFLGSNAVNWAALSHYERFVIIAGGILSAGDAIDAFLDQTLTRMREGKPIAEPTKTEPTV